MTIFLDIDGVMVIAKPWTAPEFLSDDFPVFSYQAVRALNKILLETRAGIILTTSHKSKFTLQQWCNIFRLRGIDINSIDQLPDNIYNLSRRDEILNWLDSHDVHDSYIIIDDDKALNALPTSIKNRLILTSATIGLTEHLANEAITILKSQPGFILR